MRLIGIARVIRAAYSVALCLPVLASAAASPQQPADEPAGRSLKAMSVAVDVYAIVEGRGGRLIRDLNRDDFALTDGATPQKITNFSQDTNAALSLGIAIDTSLSQSNLLGT